MRVTAYTWPELEAHSLMHRGSGSISTRDDLRSEVNAACEYIVGLAERIKSSRSSTTMQMVANLREPV